jgi:hypothetical protein
MAAAAAAAAPPAVAAAATPTLDLSGSLFAVGMDSMEETLAVELPLSLDALEHSLQGMDTDHSRFGTALCRRLGYMQINAASWAGDEEAGTSREVSLVVKCPPKPMLPDQTRVVVQHRLVRQGGGRLLLLERGVSTLDIPYGETFEIQERWVATDTSRPGEQGGVHLSVSCFVHFRSRSMLAGKIRLHSHKKSKKCAVLCAELLMQANRQEQAISAGDPAGGELAEMREKYDGAMAEAQFFRSKVAELEREVKRLQQTRFLSFHKSKRALAAQLVAAEVTLARERRERVAMEEALTEAYSTTMREMVALTERLEAHDALGAGGPSSAASGKVQGRFREGGPSSAAAAPRSAALMKSLAKRPKTLVEGGMVRPRPVGRCETVPAHAFPTSHLRAEVASTLGKSGPSTAPREPRSERSRSATRRRPGPDL